MAVLQFDEINALAAPTTIDAEILESKFAPYFGEDGKIRSREDAEDIIDEMLDLLLLSYAEGVESVNASMGTSIEQPAETVERTLYEPIEGKTWVDRVWDYYENGGTVYDIARIAATEAHRDANAAAYDAAIAAGATTKTWHCMMLPTSRDTHVYLDGVTAPIDGYFYSFKGGQTQYPGQWGIAEEDINCLCWLTYS